MHRSHLAATQLPMSCSAEQLTAPHSSLRPRHSSGLPNRRRTPILQQPRVCTAVLVWKQLFCSRGPQEKAGYLALNSRRHSGLWLCLSGTGLFSSISERCFSLLSVTQGQTRPGDTKELENRLPLTSKNRREGR